ncbi:50S ribosomal protein L35 [Enterococcus sp. BWR-S5]|nr:50S ribosomal protein L35 [Enterococcus sp. BWR-S5]MBL1225617.1 50S ribosomal protein L35 [Enterococcus sp. BWR-S5]
MPKMKTHSGLKKRVKVSKSGDIKRKAKSTKGSTRLAKADLHTVKKAIH